MDAFYQLIFRTLLPDGVIPYLQGVQEQTALAVCAALLVGHALPRKYWQATKMEAVQEFWRLVGGLGS